MNYNILTPQIENLKTDCLIIFVSPNTLSEQYALHPRLEPECRLASFEGKQDQKIIINIDESIARIMLVGTGESPNLDKLQTAFKSSFKALPKEVSNISVMLQTNTEISLTVQAQNLSLQFEHANYGFNDFKSPKDDAHTTPSPENIFLLTDIDALESLNTGAAIGAGMNFTRDLGNLPGNICNPAYLAEQARQLDDTSAITTTVLGEEEMQGLGMGALLSVSRGSEQEGHLITMEYNGGNNNENPIVLVGKGVTFDTGGISIKPSAGMEDMKYDMCGAATVFGVMKAVAALELPINVVGVVPTVENMPDGKATRPGDIVKSMSGMSIEIDNTDAEGRLILCDALTYSAKFNPKVVIDMATLTGACIVALGYHTAAVIGNHADTINALKLAGEQSHDRCWELPYWPEYNKQIDHHFADVKNTSGREAATITAACFLGRFCEEYNWAHLDIAGRAWTRGEVEATGYPVPLIMQYLQNQS